MRIRAIIVTLFLTGCTNPDAKQRDPFQGEDVGLSSDTSNGTSSLLLASNFEQGCAFDSECTLVGEGDVCACAPCEDAAIHVNALPAYTEERENLSCPNDIDPLIRCDPDCENRVPVCASNQCDAREPTFIDASVYRRDCETVEDCVLIFTGEVCSPCRCGTAAIHRDDLASYQTDSNTDCAPDPTVGCDCEPATVLGCEEGQCTVSIAR